MPWSYRNWRVRFGYLVATRSSRPSRAQVGRDLGQIDHRWPRRSSPPAPPPPARSGRTRARSSAARRCRPRTGARGRGRSRSSRGRPSPRRPWRRCRWRAGRAPARPEARDRRPVLARIGPVDPQPAGLQEVERRVLHPLAGSATRSASRAAREYPSVSSGHRQPLPVRTGAHSSALRQRRQHRRRQIGQRNGSARALTHRAQHDRPSVRSRSPITTTSGMPPRSAWRRFARSPRGRKSSSTRTLGVAQPFGRAAAAARSANSSGATSTIHRRAARPLRLGDPAPDSGAPDRRRTARAGTASRPPSARTRSS